MHYIYKGRWFKDERFMNGYINSMYQKSGNNLAYSKSITDAAYACYLMKGDKQYIISQLDSMKMKYDQWSDHWEDTGYEKPDGREETLDTRYFSAKRLYISVKPFRLKVSGVGYLAQSSLSNTNISSTRLLKSLEIFKERIVDGMYLPVSIENIVCLDTFSRSANSCCVRPRSCRSSRTLFFIRP